jgi:DNA-binding MarR family transcriptional regulator
MPTTTDPEDYVGCLAGHLRAAARAVTRAYDAALRPTGLRITQVAVLAHVARHQPATVTELGRALSSERSAVARDVTLLQDAGLVTVRVKADDRRAREVRLTPDGDHRLRAAAPAWHAAQRDARDALGDARVDALVALAADAVVALEPE